MFYGIRTLMHPTMTVTAHLPLAQAKLETGNFTSNIYRTNHNLFGMMYPATRASVGESTAIAKDAKGFAMFKSDFDSIRDYFFWLKNWSISTNAELDAFLASGKYAAAKNYHQKVTEMAATVVPELIDPKTFLVAAAIGTVALGAGVAAVVKASK